MFITAVVSFGFFLYIGWSLLQNDNFTRYHNHVGNAGRGCQQPNWTGTSNASKDCVSKEFFCHFEDAIFSKERGTGFSFGNSLQLRSRRNEQQITEGVIKIISKAILFTHNIFFWDHKRWDTSNSYVSFLFDLLGETIPQRWQRFLFYCFSQQIRIYWNYWCTSQWRRFSHSSHHSQDSWKGQCWGGGYRYKPQDWWRFSYGCRATTPSHCGESIGLSLSSYVQTDASTPNIVGPTMLGVVASVLAVLCKRMQQLPTLLGRIQLIC